MHYKKFIIEQYKAISEPLTVKFSEQGIIPIIGVNECGKTTILKALLAFDDYNDCEDERYEQLQDVSNNYTLKKGAIISAEIDISKEEIDKIYKTVIKKTANKNDILISSYIRAIENIKTITIKRIINKKRRYEFSFNDFTSFGFNNFNQEFCIKIIEGLPIMLYYDDFRDRIKDTITVTNKDTDDISEKTLQRIFESAGENLWKTLNEEDNHRLTIISKVEDSLNKVLTSRWSQLQAIEEGVSENLRVKLNFKIQRNKKQITIKITEKVNEEIKYFNLDQRSKGFFWFFNFTTKTAFNPSSDEECIYLLDEPGCYLHSSAQEGLCKILNDLSKDHFVVYNTHSQYLLSNEFLPKTHVAFRDTDNNNNIKLRHFSEYNKQNNKGLPDALQPLRDALHTKPSLLEKAYSHDTLIIVEGMLDYHTLINYDDKRDYGVVAMTAASNMLNFIGIALACRKKVFCLLDGDKEGIKTKETIENHYEDHVVIHNLENGHTIENLFDLDEIDKLRKESYFEDLNTVNREEKGYIKRFIKLMATAPDKTKYFESLKKTRKNISNEIDTLLQKQK